MRRHGIAAKRKRQFRRTTIINPKDRWSGNVVNRDFAPAGPNRVWTSDITYLSTKDGWMYLSVVLDLYSRRVVGWALQPNMTEDLVIEAMSAALQLRRPHAGLIHHSDRGTQYAANNYGTLLKNAGVISSMSRKGNCWDNAPTESFFATLKKEIGDLKLCHERRFGT